MYHHGEPGLNHNGGNFTAQSSGYPISSAPREDTAMNYCSGSPALQHGNFYASSSSYAQQPLYMPQQQQQHSLPHPSYSGAYMMHQPSFSPTHASYVNLPTASRDSPRKVGGKKSRSPRDPTRVVVEEEEEEENAGRSALHGVRGEAKHRSSPKRSTTRRDQPEEQAASHRPSSGRRTKRGEDGSRAARMQELLDEKKLLIKPFTPANLFKYHCHLTLGQHFYRANPKCGLINPYHVEGVAHGFSEKVHVAVEWRTVRQVLTQAGDISEEDLNSGFDDGTTEGSLDPEDCCLIVNPLETIIGHTEEYIAVAQPYWPVIEAVPDLGRCGICVSFAYTPPPEQQIYRPVIVITNTSRYAKAVLVAGRPVLSLVLLNPVLAISPTELIEAPTISSTNPTTEDNNTPPPPPPPLSLATPLGQQELLREFSRLWHPTSLLNPNDASTSFQK